MFIKRFAKVLFLLSIVAFVFSETEVSGDCAEILKILSEEKPNNNYYENTIKECKVDAEGKLSEM